MFLSSWNVLLNFWNDVNCLDESRYMCKIPNSIECGFGMSNGTETPGSPDSVGNDTGNDTNSSSTTDSSGHGMIIPTPLYGSLAGVMALSIVGVFALMRRKEYEMNAIERSNQKIKDYYNTPEKGTLDVESSLPSVVPEALNPGMRGSMRDFLQEEHKSNGDALKQYLQSERFSNVISRVSVRRHPSKSSQLTNITKKSFPSI